MMDSQGDQEPIEIVVPGQYYFRNGSHYLRYEELLDETAEPTINYIKMSEKGLEVSKKGLVNVHMVFEKEKQISSQYHTPAGVIQMEIFTSRLRTRQEGENIETEIVYDLHMNDVFISECRVVIRVASKEKAELHII